VKKSTVKKYNSIKIKIFESDIQDSWTKSMESNFVEFTGRNVAVALVGDVPAGPNLLRRLTHGLKQVHAEIAASSRFGAVVASRGHTDYSTGCLLSNIASLPSLCKRYKLEEKIGEGTFSQIFRSVDNYRTENDNKVAIKVMKIGYNQLGVRESIFLRHFMAQTIRSTKYFVGIYDAFQFEQHVCIVLELFDLTLINFLNMNKFDISSDNIVKPIVTGGLIKPAANRYTSQSNHQSNSIYNDNKAGQRHLNTTKLKKIACSLLSALVLLKKEGVIHADIKPENCFIRLNSNSPHFKGKVKKEVDEAAATLSHMDDLPDDFELRLGDFGNAIILSEVASYFSNFDIQTLSYRAPEVLFGLPFGSAIDLWSCGILLLELCIGKPLFVARSRMELAKEIESKLISPRLLRFSSGKYMEELSSEETVPLVNKVNFSELIMSVHKLLSKAMVHAPSELVHLIAGLLHPDPEARLTAVDALQHPFIAAYVPIPMHAFFKANTNKSIALNLFRESLAKKTVKSGRNQDSVSMHKPTTLVQPVSSATPKPVKTLSNTGSNLLQNLLSPPASATSAAGLYSDGERRAQSTPTASNNMSNTDNKGSSRKAYIREQTNSLLTASQPPKAGARGNKRRLVWNEITERYESSGGEDEDEDEDDDYKSTESDSS
jgi:serine/threonine protein kinase